MIAGYELNKLEDVVNNYIDKKKKIVKKHVVQFSTEGENYGGILLKVDLVLAKDNIDRLAEREELSLIIKTIPPTEYFQILFNSQVSVKVEIFFYEVIIPTLVAFQKQYGAKKSDLFPKFYGGRLSLDKMSEKVDRDSIIVLENLQVEGYINVDRFQGYDMETAKLILKSIAEFHGAPLALKIKEPEIFENKIKPHFSCYYPKSDIPTVPTTGMLDILCEKEYFKKYHSKVKKSLLAIYEFPKEFREPFFTLAHRDLWINNILVKYANGKPMHVKFIDFQKYSYDSPAKDLIYFLITSLPLELLKRHFYDFLKYYHQCLIDYLTIFSCNVEPFRYEEFIKEVGISIDEELGHTLFMMLFVAYGKQGGADKVNGKVVWDNKNNVPPEGREKFWWFIQECIDRQWL